MSKIESFDVLIDKCKEDALVKLCGAFGIPNEWYDAKDGGNISTEHNAKKCIFANEEDRQNFSSFGTEFDRKDWDDKAARGQEWKEINQKRANGESIPDGYTGKTLETYENHHGKEKLKADMDHVKPLKKLHEDPSMHLYFSESERKDIANSNSNLVMTDPSVNRSKGAKTNSEFLSNGDRAEELQVSKVRMKAQEIKSEAVIKTKVAIEQGKRVAVTGTAEGLKMGLRAAMGKALAELGLAVFAEMKDIWKNGFTGDSANWLVAIKDRFMRILDKVKAKLVDVLIAFKDGAISGFLGNLVTFLINKVATTYQALVKAIRESFRELWRAIKLLIWPPKDMTFGEAILEVTKILTATVITGVMVWFQPQIFDFVSALPLIGAYAKEISFAIVGIASGTLSLVAAYLLDKFFAKHDYDKELFEKMTQNLEIQEQLCGQLTEQCHLNLQIAGVNEEIILSNEQMLQDRWNLNRDTLELIEPVDLFAIDNSSQLDVYANLRAQLTSNIENFQEFNSGLNNLMTELRKENHEHK